MLAAQQKAAQKAAMASAMQAAPRVATGRGFVASRTMSMGSARPMGATAVVQRAAVRRATRVLVSAIANGATAPVEKTANPMNIVFVSAEVRSDLGISATPVVARQLQPHYTTSKHVTGLIGHLSATYLHHKPNGRPAASHVGCALLSWQLYQCCKQHYLLHSRHLWRSGTGVAE
eukprot:GHRQ01017767.1.p1 GENE.GHRQ01017767.1~~GHRQ01017767.1.p1  ORF type:complete len:175 (-),score=32.16 GHRQ01017767.1:261-785(-)